MIRNRFLTAVSSLPFLAGLLLTALISRAQSQQPCRIISVKDTNLFLTRDSLLISLANVETISINAADALQRKIAQRYFRNIEQKLLNKSFIMEIAGRDDSSAQVHLFRALPAGRHSYENVFWRFSCYGLGMSMAQRRKETALIIGLSIPEERLNRNVENSLLF
jgi:hypothetical protein